MADFKAIFAIVGAATFLYFMMGILTSPTPQVASEKAADAITYYAVPWWIKAIQFVVNIPVIGGLLTVGIVVVAVLRSRSSS